MRTKNVTIEKMKRRMRSISMAGAVILKRKPATATTDRKEWLESTVKGVKIITDARETELGGEVFGWNESVDVLPDHIYNELRLQMLDLHWEKCGAATEAQNGIS